VSEALAVLGWVLFALAAIGALYTLTTGFALRWFLGRPAPSATEFPPVTILKPLHGDEPGLRACLEGFCRQDYPGPVQIVFGVRDSHDAAIPVVRALMAADPELDIELVVDGRVYGANLKISNLINMDRAAKHPVVVLADSDVSVTPDYLRCLTGALADPEVGFATCAFVGVPTGNLWSRLSAMAINHHFLPSIAFGMWIKLAKPCFGPTVAFRREVFDLVGGFPRFADHLADDFEIGRAIRELGYGFSVPSLLIGHGCPETSGRAVVSHELRWARTIRLCDPASYAGSVICHPLPWAILAMLVLGGSPASLALLAVVIGARLFVAGEVGRLAGADMTTWWLSPVRDLLSGGVHVAGFLTRTVTWRGRRFHVGRDGVLRPYRPQAVLSPAEPQAVQPHLAPSPLGLAREPSSAI
jgi:ceramide glucosyltransferase